MRRSALLFASLALLVGAGCGSSGPTPTVKLSHQLEPISGGQTDTTHTSVVAIITMGNGGIGMCSGTLIAPNLVLTARHCVAPLQNSSSVQPGAVICGQTTFGPDYSAGALHVTTDTNVSYQSYYSSVPGQEVRVPSEGNDGCGYDVALIILSKKITSVKPYVPRIDEPVSLGEVYTAVGYGMTRTPTSSSDTAGAGTRRERTGLHVSWYRGGSYDPVCGTKPACGYGVASSEWQGEIGVCEGDSGGPALDANKRVVGVVSRGASCDYPTYSSVSTWKDFIIKAALDAAKAGGYTAPTWATTGSTGTGGAGGAAGAGAGGAGGSGAGGQAAGGAGGAAGGPVTTADPQGTACSKSAPCPTGYQCVYDSDPSKAYCAADCDANNACSPGLECVSVGQNAQVCKNAQKPAADTNTSSGCTLSQGRGPAKPVPWFIGLSLVGLAALRRRR